MLTITINGQKNFDGHFVHSMAEFEARAPEFAQVYGVPLQAIGFTKDAPPETITGVVLNTNYSRIERKSDGTLVPVVQVTVSTNYENEDRFVSLRVFKSEMHQQALDLSRGDTVTAIGYVQRNTKDSKTFYNMTVGRLVTGNHSPEMPNELQDEPIEDVMHTSIEQLAKACA